jgi:Stealth protein CR2, conserved region 2/Stealth protein CR3, conserved region 3/Stealth protein CR1, conserved region 1
MMLAMLRRLRGLWKRYRADRRLPPMVRDLMVEVVRLRCRDRVGRLVVMFRPKLGGSGNPAVLAWRKIATAGALDRSIAELALDNATEVSRVLSDSGVEHFVTDQRDDRIVLGMRLSERARALNALAGADLGDGWYGRWEDRGRSGLTELRRVATGPARRARALTVFRAMAVGERATGPEAGAVLTFYDLGSSGQLELVGTRGHERFDQRSRATSESIRGRSFPGRSAFPVAASLERLAVPVDVVYTWVDGADEQWLADFRRVAREHGRAFDDAALDPARYRSRDELRYSLRSLWMYAGWVNHIYIVTAGQRPPWLQDHPAISVVDHREILPPEALPTFNSHAIEASLHLIDDLSEHFVYFNDDMFLGRPTRPELFFTPNGLARVFESGARVPGAEDEQTLAVDTAARRGQSLLERQFGRSVTRKPLHSPYPLRRSALFDMCAAFSDEVEATRHSRFRSPSDISVAASLGQHYALATGQAVHGDVSTEYVHVESGRLAWHLDRIRLSGRFDTFCINETNDGSGLPDRERTLRVFFDDVLPEPAPWEVP